MRPVMCLVFLAAFACALACVASYDLGHISPESQQEISLEKIAETWQRWLKHKGSIGVYWDHGAGCNCDFQVMCTADYECAPQGKSNCHLDECCGTSCKK